MNVKLPNPVMRFDWEIELEKSSGGAPPGTLHGAGGVARSFQVAVTSLQLVVTLCKLNHRFVVLVAVVTVNLSETESTTDLGGMKEAISNASKARFLPAPPSGPSVPALSVVRSPWGVSKNLSEIVVSAIGAKLTLSARISSGSLKHAKTATASAQAFI
jgi:hypothetical protein